jgi:hypothetical protein
MNELDQAMEIYMAYLVHMENRPFSYRDFMEFEVEGKVFRMTHGTFRNKIGTLKNAGKVELAYNAGTAYYTLKGKRFGTMTPNHTGVSHPKMDSLSRLIHELPTETAAVHDIRLKFQVKDIWSKLSSIHPETPVNQRSKDICIPTWRINDLHIRTVVHKSDTVSVIVACSLAPVALSFNGINELSSTLTRAQERLNVILNNVDYCRGDQSKSNDDVPKNPDCIQYLRIPDPKNWVVTMWHFGTDALVEYTGDRFAISWEAGQNVLVRAYTKKMEDKKRRVRLERQEYPKKSLQQIVDEKLNQTTD